MAPEEVVAKCRGLGLAIGNILMRCATQGSADGRRTGLSVPMQEALAPLQDSGPTVYMTTRRSPTLLGEGRVRYTLSHTHTSAGHDSTVCVSPSAPGPCASHGGGGAVTAGVRRRRSAAGARLPPTVSPVGVRRSVGAFASGGNLS